MKRNIIYGLKDPLTNEIRYIGKSTSGLSRPRSHLTPNKYLKENNYKAKWIKSLIHNGIIPEIVILCETDNILELDKLEIEFIKEYRSLGYRLTNLTDGGEGSLGRVLSAETKEKISKKKLEYYKHKTEPIICSTKKEHIIMNDKTLKTCPRCKESKQLDQFGKNKNNWDGLHNYCKKCWREKIAESRIRNPEPKLTEEQLKASYENRSKAVSDGLKRKFAIDPGYAEGISERNSKAIIGTNVVTGETIEFKSGLMAKEHGFNNTNISIAIKNNKQYKGYIWSKKLTTS